MASSGDALERDRQAQIKWKELMKDAPDKDALDKKEKQLEEGEKATLKTYEEHVFELAALKLAYDDLTKGFSVQTKLETVVAGSNFKDKFHVSKTSAFSDWAKPAQFGWNREDGKEVYIATGALTIGYFEVPSTEWTFDWWGGFDFDVSSDHTKNPGKLIQRLAAMYTRKNQGTFNPEELHLTYLPSIAHEANRNFKSKALVGQYLVEPAIALGDLPINLRKHGFQFGPQVGFEVGEAFNKTKGKSPEDGGFVRGFLKVRMDVYPAGFKNKLLVYADNTTRFLGDDHYHQYNLFNAGFSYDISDQVSLNVDEAIGRDSPTLEFSSKLTLGLGLQF